MADGVESSLERGPRFLLVAGCVAVVVAGLKAAASLILPLLIALFLAMISLPLLNWQKARRVPTPIAVGSTLVVVIGGVFGLAALIGGSVAGFIRSAPRYRERLDAMVVDASAWFEARGLGLPAELAADFASPGQIVDLATTTLRGVAAALSNLLLVFLTLLFVYLEAAGFPAKLQAALGDVDSSARVAKIRREINQYLGIKTLVSLTTGGVIGVAMAVIGVDFAILWGVLAFLLNCVPNLGSILASIPPTLMALMQLGVGRAIAVALVFLAANVILGSLVEPQLLGRRLGLSTLVVFLSLVFWGWVWGPVGMLLSVPLTMVIKIMLENSRDLRWIAVLLDASPVAGVPREGSRE